MKTLTFLLVLVFSLPASSFAAQGTENTCNQPMADRVTHIQVEQGAPFQSAVSPDGCWIFVSVGRTPTGTALAKPGIAVLRRDRGRIEQSHFFQIAATGGESFAFVQNGRILAVPTARELVFLDVDKLMSGKADPVISRVGDHRFLNGNTVTMSADGHWLFALQYDTQWMSVIDITGLSSPTGARIVGGLATGVNPHEAVLSPDGKYLYLPSSEGSDASWPEVCESSNPNNPGKHREGSIQVIDVKRALSDPSTSVVATIRAGCSTRRVAVSPDGRTLYATAGDVLAFDAQPLERGLPPTLKGKVTGGETPVGIVAVDGGKRLIVANQGPFGTVEKRRERKETLTVIDASKISTGSGAVLGTVSVGADPRNITVTPDGRTLLVNNSLGTLDVFDIERLPLRVAAQAAAQQASSSNACNQPLTDAVTHFKVEQGFPWQSIVTPDGCWIFVAVNRTPAGNQLANRGIAVLRRDRGKIEQRHFVKVQTTGNLTLIRNGTVLVVSAYPATIFMDVAKLTSGQSNPEISRVSDTHFLNGGIVAVTRDDRWLFAAQRDTEWLSIVDISGLSTTGAKIVGGLATGVVPGLLVLSPDEKYLYLASRVGIDPSWPEVCNASPELLTGNVKQREGAIQILDVQRAISDPSSSVVATIKAGCETRGLAVSPDGRTIFATAMLDNMVLAFDAEPLEKGLPPTFKGKVAVGALPASVVGVDGGKTLVVSNANLFAGTTEERQDRKETLTVIDASNFASASAAVLGTIEVGASPQNLAISVDGRTLLVNNNLGTLDLIDLERLPLQPVKP